MLLFSSCTFAAGTKQDDKRCLVNRDCEFAARTVNGSEIINTTVCNLTIWNTTMDLYFGPHPLENRSTGFHNYTFVFNQSGEFFSEIRCVFGGVTEIVSQDILVETMLENAGLLALTPLGIAFLFIGIASFFFAQEEQYTFRLLFFLIGLTFGWGAIANAKAIATADAFTILESQLNALLIGYTAFLIAVWSLFMYVRVVPHFFEVLRKGFTNRRRF